MGSYRYLRKSCFHKKETQVNFPLSGESMILSKFVRPSTSDSRCHQVENTSFDHTVR